MTKSIDDDLDQDYDDVEDVPPAKDTEKSNKVRRRIDEILEQKRLRELLDDSDDWTV